MQIIKITDFNMPELDIYARLTENQLLNRHEPEKGIFIAESPKVIERALSAGYEPMSVLIEDKHIETAGREVLKKCGNIPVYTASFELLKELTGFELTRGMLCAMRRKPLKSIEEICREKKKIAIMENVMNPTNVGAIFRSAAALGIEAVLLTEDCSNPLYRRAIRVSMGNVFNVPWTFISSSDYVSKLKGMDYLTVAMALKENSIAIDNPLLKTQEKLAIILGSEGEGLRKETIKNCDYTVIIPMTEGIDSLNVAAASAVAFWELTRG